MGLYCILCGKKDKSVSYLRFPSNKHIRKQWLKFCKKSEKNLYDSHRLCTDHFKPEDLKKRLRCVVVQEKAVPCIYMVKRQFLTMENASEINDGNICSTEIISNDLKNDNINENYLPPNNCLTPLKQNKDVYCSSKKRCLDFDSAELVSNDNIDSTIPIQELPVSALTSTISAPSMIPDPRYVGDIQLSHLAIPKQAARVINLMQRTVTQQRQKIKTLQKKVSRCKQRISSLKDLVFDLNKRNYVSEAATNIFMVRLNSIYRSIMAPNAKNDNLHQRKSRIKK